MEFRCSKTYANSPVARNHSGRAFALPFGSVRAEADAAPTFVEKVTAFLERYNRVPAQRVPPGSRLKGRAAISFPLQRTARSVRPTSR